jgi:hypothetical protein
MPAPPEAKKTNQFGRLDIKGLKFGMLLVLRPARPLKGKRRWECICDCQLEKPENERETILVRHDYLLHTNHPKTHCGCANRGLATEFNQEYHIWNMMIRRTTNPTHESYPKYGGRGIRVCDEWLNSFKAFLDHIGPRPSKNHSIDRIDADKNYEPGNVRWATSKEQARNKRDSIFLPHPEDPTKMIPAAEVAEIMGIPYQQMRAQYIRQGRWPTQYVQVPTAPSDTSASSATDEKTTPSS